MAVQKKTFEVSVDTDKAALAFDLRANVVDWVRARIQQKMRTAEDAGVDKRTAAQKFGLLFAGAAKLSRMVRAVPPGLVRWALVVELNGNKGWYPPADPGTVGTFEREAVRVITNDIAIVNMGGITFIGQLPGGVPEDFVELRVGRLDSGYLATIVYGKPEDDNRVDEPEPVDGERLDA